MITIAIANQKGGCGKTTTAINLAACLGKKNQRVLLIDMDPQGHASMGLGMKNEDVAGLYEVFLDDVDMQEVILPEVTQGVDLIPATISLAAVEHLLGDIPKREQQLKLHIDKLTKQYDFIIIDSPPTLGLLSFNALRAANEVLVPFELSVYSLDGIERLCETIELLEEKYELDIPIQILPTLVDYRSRFAKEMLNEVRARFPDEMAATSIHYTVRLKEAASRGIPVIEHAPHSAATADYDRLSENYILRYETAVHTRIIAALESDSQKGIPAETTESPSEIIKKIRDLDLSININKASPIKQAEKQQVTLSFNNLGKTDLKIAGDFNGWIPDHNVVTLRDEGTLKKILNVPPGAYQYRLVMDGKWQEDPTNPHQVTNLYGEVNSLLRVQNNHHQI